MARARRTYPSPFYVAPKNTWLLPAVLAVVALLVGVFLAPVLAESYRSVKASIDVMRFVTIGMGALLAIIAVLRYIGSRPGRNELPPSLVDTILVLPSSTDPTLLAARPRSRASRSQPKRRQEIATHSPEPTRWSYDLIQSIEWKRFEDLCDAYYREKGMRGETKPLGIAGGIEIRLFQDGSTLTSAIVQCKEWKVQQVDTAPLQEMLAVMRRGKITKGFFMTRDSFSAAAKEFAGANRIILVDGKLFLAMIQRLPADAQQRLLDFATSGNF